MTLHFSLPFIEQYDAFVKFTHDQLMRRFGEQPSSCKFYSMDDLKVFLSFMHQYLLVTGS